jgi:alpha-N-arabinofuranosidase
MSNPTLNAKKRPRVGNRGPTERMDAVGGPYLRAEATLDPTFTIGTVDPRLFGALVEHMGRCIYGGIYDPDDARADADGFRTDVLELVRELGVRVVRYPGGNFVSGYDWEDGVGARETRPRRLDLAWHAIETNAVGIDDFVSWSRRAEAEVMLAVNLGTRGVDAARALVEYCNAETDTMWADRRRANGHPEPHSIKLWCLGNEMDAPWQLGHKSAAEYADLALEAGKAMRLVDPTIELIACGSSNRDIPSFLDWERTVLEHAYDVVDYVSLHAYYEGTEDSPADFLASSQDMERQIADVIAACDYARARRAVTRRMMLSFDEWNVWYQSRSGFTFATGWDVTSHASGSQWSDKHRLIEDTYSLLDAIVVGTLIITLLRHADRVRIGCLAQLVNVIAPIRAEPDLPAWRQTTFYPFAHAAAYGRGTALRIELRCPTFDAASHGDIPLIDLVATLDEEHGTLTVFAVNKSLDKPSRLDLDLHAFPDAEQIECIVLADADSGAANTASTPRRVEPQRSKRTATIEDGRLAIELPPLSWNVIRLRLRRNPS